MKQVKVFVVFMILFVFGNLFFGAIAMLLDFQKKRLAIFMVSASFVLSLFLTQMVSKKLNSEKKPKRLFPGR